MFMTEPQDNQHGQIIFLNGTSSAGKTTLAHAIQEESQQPYLLAGIDSFFAMVPEKWAAAGQARSAATGSTTTNPRSTTTGRR
jgi:chloramphenicol 3-O-phosphotransferase